MQIKISKGFDINLAGKAEQKVGKCPQPEIFAIKPSDFKGLYRPKVLVQQGDYVKAGSPIFLDKRLEEVMFTAPVSGEVVEIKRGDRRKLLEIKILADREIVSLDFKKHTVSELAAVDREKLLKTLLESGTWVNIIQRPYGIIADPKESPKAIFISAFDSSPLAPDYNFIFKGQQQYFQAGLDVLKKVGGCPVHLTLDSRSEVSSIFNGVKNVEVHKISGKHPAGNVGVQIHHIRPINKGEVIWTINPYGVIQIGKLFLDGKYDASKLVALVGSEVTTPQYYETYIGACVGKLFEQGVRKGSHCRVISGNVLTGEKIEKDGFLGFYDHQITVIPEGDTPRFFLTDGWFAPIKNRLSFHRAFGLFSFLNPQSKEYVLDSSLNGEPRAFVMTGVFEDVTPMDIYPMQLIKAIMAEDIEGMEALGIYEVIEEDLALCEFVDVSKHEIQEILRKGLDTLRLS